MLLIFTVNWSVISCSLGQLLDCLFSGLDRCPVSYSLSCLAWQIVHLFISQDTRQEIATFAIYSYWRKFTF